MSQNVSPMLADDLVRLDNVPEDRSVPDILELQRAPASYITALDGRGDPRLHRVDERAWRLEAPGAVVLGRVGDDLARIDPPKKGDAEVRELPPAIPKWGGIEYHPKLSVAERHIPLRRRKGQRVTPHYVFGPDDRQVFYPGGYPWRCTGRVFVWTDPSAGWAWYGSGTLVGPNVMLTASHVVPWGAKSWMMKFVPAYYDGSSLYGSSVYSYVQSARGYNPHGQGDDMAVCRLYTPLGNTFGWFGSRTYHDGWEDGHYWTKVGYAAAVTSQRPNRIQWFPIIDDDNDGAGVELEYRADSSGGDSGGPVFGWWTDGPYVVGTHSGGEEEYHFPFSIVKNNVSAGGSALVNLIRWGLDHW